MCISITMLVQTILLITGNISSSNVRPKLQSHCAEKRTLYVPATGISILLPEYVLKKINRYPLLLLH